MFNECLYRYLKLFVPVDGFVFLGLFTPRGLSSHRWIVRCIDSTLGRFGSAVDGSLFLDLSIIRGLSAHIGWIVRCSGSMLGWFASSVIVFSNSVCLVFSPRCSGFLDGVV